MVATGDLHSYIASTVKHRYGNLNPLDFNNFIGAEFMTPAVTSSNLGEMLGAKLTPQQRTALMQGLADGYFVIPYTIGDYLAQH